ncbi:MAG: hypothetical protein L0Y61_07015, partial [Epsilonproteobacteria bacterium]|nr:hypothetical protein [Campylobacterota bacterium]
LLAMAYFVLMYAFADWISNLNMDPKDRGYPSMPFGQMLFGFVGTLVLTPLSIFVYRKHWLHRNMKIIASALLFASTTVIFLITEVRYL